MSTFHDYWNLQLINQILPEIRPALIFCRRDSALYACAAQAEQSLLDLRQEIATRLGYGANYELVTIAFEPDDAMLVYWRLVKSVRDTILHYGSSGELVNVLKGVYQGLMSLQPVEGVR